MRAHRVTFWAARSVALAIVVGTVAAGAARSMPAPARAARAGGRVVTDETAPPFIPVFAGQLVGPLRRYRAYVSGRIALLQTEVAALTQAISVGDMASARGAWLTAHLTWLSIGQDDGAYGAFGPLGRAIDGTSAGYVGGAASPRFTGFHRVELDLWRRDDLSGASAETATLTHLIRRLAATPLTRALPANRLGLINFTLRVHEVLEDALRDTLSGDDDYGSGTGLASLTADIAATRELLGLLGPLITPRAPVLATTARRELDALSAAIAATRRDGSWIGVAELPILERERVDADTGAALQTLARVPDLLSLPST